MSVPSWFEFVTGAAADLANAAAGKVRLFVDVADGIAKLKDDAGTVTSLQGPTGSTGSTGPAGMDAFPVTVVQHGNCGSTETFDFGDGSYVAATSGAVHKGTVNADLTVTLATSAASGDECILTVELVEDGTGGWSVTLPVAVSNAAEIEALVDTTPGASNFLVFRSTDAGTSWIGFLTNTTGATGATGAVGGAIAIPYTFFTTTADADPGSGNLRLDNATQNAATTIRADLADANGATWTTVLDAFDEATSTITGQIRLFKTDDPTKFLVFSVTAVDSSSGYRNITVVCDAYSAASPFANSDAITLAFTRTGDGGAASAPTTATYITASADAGLSAEVVHPELGSTWQSGSELDFSGAATGTSVTANAVTGCAGAIDYKNVGYQYWDIASAIGTGDFDVRARILSAGPGATQMAGSNSCNFYLALTDSSRTQATGLCIQAAGWGGSAAVPQIIARDGIGGTQVGVTYYVGGQFPLILRVARVGTAVTRYVSIDGGLVWQVIGANTSSLNVAKIGIWGFAPNATGQRILVHKIMG